MAAPTKAKKETAPAADPYAAAAGAAAEAAPVQGSKPYLRLPKNVQLLAPEAGRPYKLRFLAWKAGKGNHVAAGGLTTTRFFGIHQGIGPDSAKVFCPTKLGKKCPTCEAFNLLRQDRTLDYKKSGIGKLKSKDRELFLVHDVDGKPNNLFAFEESVHLFGNFFRAMVARREAYAFYAHPQKGFIVEIEGVKKQIETNSCVEFPNIIMEQATTPLSKELLAAVDRLCPDDWLVEVPYESHKKLLNMGVIPGQKSATAERNGTTEPDAEPEAVTEEGDGVVSAEEEEEVVTETEDDEPAVDVGETEEVPDEEPEPDAEPGPEEDSEPVEEAEEIEDIEDVEDVEEVEDDTPKFKVKDKVSFILKGNKTLGEITEIKGDRATVKSGNQKFAVKLDKLTASKKK